MLTLFALCADHCVGGALGEWGADGRKGETEALNLGERAADDAHSATKPDQITLRSRPSTLEWATRPFSPDCPVLAQDANRNYSATLQRLVPV